MVARASLLPLLVGVVALFGCDVKVDTSDLEPELRPKSGQTIERTIAHASCGGSDTYLEYENEAGEPVARCFGQKEDTQICSLATCTSSSDLSEDAKRRNRKTQKQQQDAQKLKQRAKK